MSDSYVTSQATIKCSCGDKCAKLTVYPDRTVFLTEKPMANISDHVSMYNVAPFGKCHTVAYPPTGSATAANHGHLTPMPCVPGTVSEWINGKSDYIVKGKPALLKSSYCRCKWGGIITITDDGQVDTGNPNLDKLQIESEEDWNEKEQEELLKDKEALLDGIQSALDIAGFLPGVGAIPDLLNAAIYAVRGDKLNAGLSFLAAVPGIGDVATATKFAQKSVKAAKAAKKAVVTQKTASIGQPFGTLIAKQNTATIKETNGKPFLSVTAKNGISEKNSSNAPKLGPLTEKGRQPISIQTPKANTDVIPSVVEDKLKNYPEDSLKDVFKYKGNNINNKVKTKDSVDNLDLSS